MEDINDKARKIWRETNPTFGMNPYYSIGFRYGYLEALKQVKNLNIPAVIKSVCDKCRFKAECRYKEMNTEQNCKYFIDEQTVL